MAGSPLHLLVILLSFSHLISLNAVPITRTRNLLSDTRVLLPADSENTHLQASTEEVWEEELANGRMGLELNDYPGSGANNRHTPKPPLGKERVQT
ncbi:PREDICTED: uncharacterized protein LOC104597668 [Nelumbo nucifera]|uniref:Uncharacterized protein LOC104597668 n=1 Tax=Nelumbo nucifera TaxID=4432 RepID=A0A1U8A705_NELNU|nr:PREDICTED: uncharacterized protein LOC104597668 [Nelumbo nucifera]XP_010257668.1 PREDICTED: uncharacterized protein LOC104597668 [Nelumbo nucifera]XP_010257676.1 PREDICTED: uncharacterized protein LOC104597668 [Nelumbo nucifera]XP_010257687.1 PREDICTED: uncharacterized protein LOC104597668 [Nelumbo nucifera]